MEKTSQNLKEEETKTEMSSADAMRKIVSVLKKHDFDDEEIVDVIIGLRNKDEFSFRKAKRIKDEPEYEDAIKRLYK